MKEFPIMQSGGIKIPWSVAEQAYLEYTKRFGDSQTLERIAERGGFAISEMDTYYPEWREHIRLKKENKKLKEQLKSLGVKI